MSSKRKSKIKTYNPKTRSRNRKLTAVAAVAIIAIVAIVVASVFLGKLGQGGVNNIKPSSSPSPSATASSSATSSPTATANPIPSVTPLTSPAGEYSASSTKVLFRTSMGDIVIQMRDDKPITTANFVKLVNEGYYNNTIFQRVIAGFMIQGGEGNTTQLNIQDEIGDNNHNYKLTIAMANTGQPNSASSQFFINVVDNSYLDTGYTVFGQVIYGQNTVMAISNTPVGYSSEYNANVLPVTPVTVIGAAVIP